MAYDKTRLSPEEVKHFLAKQKGWRLEEGELRKTYEFKSFKEAVAFVGRLAEVAEREDHHPDIDIRFKRVHLALVTYDADGITARDPRLAELADALARG